MANLECGLVVVAVLLRDLREVVAADLDVARIVGLAGNSTDLLADNVVVLTYRNRGLVVVTLVLGNLREVVGSNLLNERLVVEVISVSRRCAGEDERQSSHHFHEVSSSAFQGGVSGDRRPRRALKHS